MNAVVTNLMQRRFGPCVLCVLSVRRAGLEDRIRLPRFLNGDLVAFVQARCAYVCDAMLACGFDRVLYCVCNNNTGRN